MLKVNNSKYFLLSCGIKKKLTEFWYLQENEHNSHFQNKHNHNLYNNPISDASWVYTTFPGITQKNTNLRYISLTRTDHDNSKLFENIQFEKDIKLFLAIFWRVSQKSKFKGRFLEGILNKSIDWLLHAPSHAEETWGQRFQLRVWSTLLNTSKILLICFVLQAFSHFF